MNGLLCSSKAKTNEEYRQVIKTRMSRMILLLVIGLITIVISIVAQHNDAFSISDQMINVYRGAGSGLTFAAIVLWFRNKTVLKDEQKLKESRLSNTDERLQEISRSSFRIASITLLIALYLVGLIGGLFYPILVNVLSGLVCIFLLVYVVSYKMYEQRM